MPLMTRIRESLSTFFSIFAGLFVVYIVLDWGMDITGRRHSSRQSESQEVGVINGTPVSFRDFSDMVRRTMDSQKQQTGQDADDEQQRAIRDQVWNQLVDQTLYDEEIKRLGITVTDQELVDWVKGDNPPEFLKQQFTDSTGTFNRQAYDATIMDPRNKQIMLRVEDALRKQREREKLQSLIMASVQVDENELKQRFVDQSVNYSANYILFDPNSLLKDNDVTISDDEVRRYYNDHSDEFKMEATRKLKYVRFPESPSHSDTTDVEKELADVLSRAKAGADFLDLAKTYSETPVNDSTFFKRGQVDPSREPALYDAAPGSLIGPVTTADGYHLTKVLGFRSGSDDFVRASHILISITANDSVAALREARGIMERAKKGEDFGELAKKYSKDPGSAIKNGDLGWFGKGRMVKPFEEAALKAKVGQIVGPVRTQFGYHIIKVTGKDDREIRFVDLHMPVKTSQQTKNDISQRAQDFVYLAKQGSFEDEAKRALYTVTETTPFQKNAVITGIGVNPALNKFAFSDKVGSISDPISVQNGIAVAMVTEAKEAGVRPFDEVKNIIQNRVKLEKKIEKLKEMASEIRKTLSPSDSLGKVTISHPNLVSQFLAPFTLNGFIPYIGRDMAFIGAVSAMTPGEISQPVEGTRGVYLIKLLTKSAFDSTAFNTQKESLRNQLLSEKRNRFFTDWSDQLKKSAEIVDNRDNFYRQ